MTAATDSVTSSSQGRSARLSRVRESLLSQEVILALVLIALVVIISLVNPRFLSGRNIFDNILLNSSYIAVAALGMTMIIISGNIDISVGAMIGVLAVICGNLAVAGWPLWLSFLIPILIGPLIGAVTGYLVAYWRIPAIVVSLGMFSILKGGLILATGGKWIYNLPDGFQFSRDPVFGIPIPVYIMFTLTIVVALWMRYSPQGREIYAVGGNAEAARLSGINTRAVLMRVFMINGLLCGIAAVMFAQNNSTIQSSAPIGLELTIITSAVIGGVSILGGIGTCVGALLGAILLPTINSSLVFLNISAYWVQSVQGALILITVLVDLLRRRNLSGS